METIKRAGKGAISALADKMSQEEKQKAKRRSLDASLGSDLQKTELPDLRRPQIAQLQIAKVLQLILFLITAGQIIMIPFVQPAEAVNTLKMATIVELAS